MLPGCVFLSVTQPRGKVAQKKAPVQNEGVLKCISTDGQNGEPNSSSNISIKLHFGLCRDLNR